MGALEVSSTPAGETTDRSLGFFISPRKQQGHQRSRLVASSPHISILRVYRLVNSLTRRKRSVHLAAVIRHYKLCSSCSWPKSSSSRASCRHRVFCWRIRTLRRGGLGSSEGALTRSSACCWLVRRAKPSYWQSLSNAMISWM